MLPASQNPRPLVTPKSAIFPPLGPICYLTKTFFYTLANEDLPYNRQFPSSLKKPTQFRLEGKNHTLYLFETKFVKMAKTDTLFLTRTAKNLYRLIWGPHVIQRSYQPPSPGTGGDPKSRNDGTAEWRDGEMARWRN